ncbi:MAG: trypsin-like peptidase domain-containing protein [Planctomycetota bacterium]|nr:trypsin-like peptidase domain-containing protein [Planctomycetota bacterium]
MEAKSDQPPLSEAPEADSRPKALLDMHLVKQPRTSGDMAVAAIKYRFARLLTTTVALLALIFGTPFLVQQIQYSIEYGRITGRHDAASVHINNHTTSSISRTSELVSYIVTPSVVHIHTSTTEQSTTSSFQHPFPKSNLFPSRGQGSGVIVSAEGYIITNRHVIQESDLIYVQLADKTEHLATVIGVDNLTDLALIKIEPTNLPPIKWTSHDSTPVGTMVWAIGSPFGLEQTITFGIVSATQRTARVGTVYQEFLQTDAAVNPGNSGGPLVNERGELLGINTAIVGDAYQGISFAVPSHVVRPVYERLKKDGRVSRGWLGLTLANVTDQDRREQGLPAEDSGLYQGAVITGFVAGYSPAEIAGFQVGDIVTRFNDITVTNMDDLIRLVGAQSGGDSTRVEIIRNGRTSTIELKLGERPQNQ